MHNLPRRKFLTFAAALVLSIAASVPTTSAQNSASPASITASTPASAPASIAADLSPDLVEDLVAANRILAHYGIFDAYGHISVRSRANPNRYLMARYLPPASTVAADITVYDLDSNALDPAVKRSFSERFIHGEIYKTRPDVMSVVHNHSPGVIPFSLSDKPLLPVMHTGGFLHGGVPVFDAAKVIADTNMMIQTPAAARALAATLDKRPIARMLAQAMALGGKVNAMTGEEARRAEASAVAPVPVDRAWIHWRKEVLGK